MTALKRLLVPHNLNDTPDTAVKHAMALARTLGARLHLFHVSGNLEGDEIRTTPRPCTVEGFTEELSACEGVGLLDLEPLTTLVVRTCHSVYRIIVLQDTTVLVQGGPCFPEVTIGTLNGSGFGGSLLKLAWIGVGLRMEIWSDGKRFVTSAVRAITTECHRSTHRPH